MHNFYGTGAHEIKGLQQISSIPTRRDVIQHAVRLVVQQIHTKSE